KGKRKPNLGGKGEGKMNTSDKTQNLSLKEVAEAKGPAKHWRVDPQTGTYDVEAIRQTRPEEITADEWDKYIQFWNNPKNLSRAAQNRQNRQKSVVICRQGSRSLACLQDEMRQASDTHEYPSLIDTFWRTHTVDGVFPKDEDRRIYLDQFKILDHGLARPP
ncbi:F-box domain containing protein, partial [Tanacetum coccineum]